MIRQPRDLSERGAITPLIVGLALVLAMSIAVVTDATAAYLQRSGLSTLADGAALYGADAAATGSSTYTEGVPRDELAVDASAARAGVAAYLQRVGARQEYPGLTYEVRVDPVAGSVHVRLTAPLELPLPVPGTPGRSMVTAVGEGISSLDE